MAWRAIRLELGCTGEFPKGSVGRAYLIRLPLNDEDGIDVTAFDRDPAKAIFRRHWASQPDRRGKILRAGDGWQMRCDGETRSLQFESRPVRLGGQISIVDDDGISLPFRIASIR